MLILKHNKNMVILMKKIIFIMCLLMLCLTGCNNNLKARDAVSNYLNLYVNLDEEVLEQLDLFVKQEGLTTEQEELYKDILKKEYSNLDYTIIDERYDNGDAYVTVSLNVYDLYKVQREAIDYFNNNTELFMEDGEYNRTKFMDYRLNLMSNVNDKVNYNIIVRVTKSKGRWEVSQLSNESLEKIHGIYNYEE